MIHEDVFDYFEYHAMLYQDVGALLMEHYKTDVTVHGLAEKTGNPLLKRSYALEEMKNWTFMTRRSSPYVLAYERTGYVILGEDDEIAIASMFSIGAESHVMSLSAHFPGLTREKLADKAIEFFQTAEELERQAIVNLIPKDEPDYPDLPDILLIPDAE